MVTVSVVIILPNQGSINYRLSLMPYRREQFNASVRPSVLPSIHPSIHPSIRPPARPPVRPSFHLFIHSFSNVIIKLKILYSVSRSTDKKTRLIMENVANGSFAEIHYSTEMFYTKKSISISLRRMAFYRCSQLFYTLISSKRRLRGLLTHKEILVDSVTLQF